MAAYPFPSPADTPFDFQSSSIWQRIKKTETASLQAEQEKEIVIHTREGDTVTLTSASRLEATYASYNSFGIAQEPVVDDQAKAQSVQAIAEKGQFYTFLDERDMAITVEGELSDEEFADIKNVIEQIDGIMTPLLNGGNPAEAISQAEKLMDLDTIAGIEADYRMKRTVAVSQSSQLDQLFYNSQGQMPTTGEAFEQSELAAPGDLAAELAKIIEESRIGIEKLRPPILQLFENMKKYYL